MGYFWPGASRLGAPLVRHLIYVNHLQCSSSTFVLVGSSFQGVVHDIHHPLHHHGDACHAIHHGRACEVTTLFKQRSFRNEFSGFEVFMLNPISVWHAWCLIVTSLCLMPYLVIIVNVTGASRCGGHLCHPGSFAQTSGALGAYCEIFIKDSCSTRPSGAKRWWL